MYVYMLANVWLRQRTCVPVILVMQEFISNWLALGFKRFFLAVATFCLGSGSQGILCLIGAY